MARYSWLLILFLGSVLKASLYSELSSLEKALVDEALERYDLTPIDSAENKSIHNIYIYTGSPFAENAGFLRTFNSLHVNTKDYIILRDIFQKPADIYESSMIKDSELSLRKRGQVRSISVIIPVVSKNTKSGKVDLLVATKDLLSLGLQFNFSGNASNITNIMVSLAENNFLGRNKSMGVSYEMQQGTHFFSGNYFDPSLFGSKFQFSINESLLFLRQGFKYDGLLSDIRLAKPLLSQTDKWGYGLNIKAGTKTVFDFQGGNVRTLELKTDSSSKTVERTYRYRYGSANLYGTYSMGTTYKKEITFGYGFNLKKPMVINESLSASEQKIFKEKLLPRDEIESFLSLGISFFQNQFLNLYDYNNFRVEETLRTGPYVTISNDFAAKPVLFSDFNFLRPKLSVSYLKPLGKDSFLNISGSTSNRFDGSFTDNTYRLGLSFVSPKMKFTRAILSSSFAQTIDNRDNQKFVLGSDSGLRGVESRFYSGNKGFTVNAELRSLPIDLWILHGGLALFYDVGAAFDSWSKANATHAIGFGVRILAPQVSSIPFRVDVAFPIYGVGQKYHSVVPSFGIGQAF